MKASKQVNVLIKIRRYQDVKKAVLNSNWKSTKYDPAIFEGYLVIYSNLLTSHNICNRQFKGPLLGVPKHYDHNL